jgi:hypothetical protein
MEIPMPIDSMLVTAAIVTMFAVFAGVLAWGERQTRSLPDAQATAEPKRRPF